MELITPTSISEEGKIGDCFHLIDSLITYNQQKYESLLKVKKSMLEKMFPKEGSEIPEIRFAGYSYAWEQHRLGDVAECSKGNGYSKSDLSESGMPIILYGRLYTKYQFVINEVDTFAIPKHGSVFSYGNEVIIPASGETADDIARASAIEKPGILLGGDLNILRPYADINPPFLALTISNGGSKTELAKRAQGKSIVHIHNSDIQEVSVSFPSSSEQRQIGNLFRLLDRLTSLHQRKCIQLQNVKRAMLQKMFV